MSPKRHLKLTKQDFCHHILETDCLLHQSHRLDLNCRMKQSVSKDWDAEHASHTHVHVENPLTLVAYLLGKRQTFIAWNVAVHAVHVCGLTNT